MAPLGVAWHVPCFGAPSLHVYTAALRLALLAPGLRVAVPDDLPQGALSCEHHSGAVLRLRLERGGLRVSVTFFLVGPDALAARVRVAGAGVDAALLSALVEYHRDLGATGLHELGLYGRDEGGVLVLGSHPGGQVLALG
ncbi:MAG TPA: hypothetical protein VIN09_04195, partial [Chloroflexota bacterium]